MNAKKEIVYIKNNIENKVILNKFNTKKIFDELFDQEIDLKEEIDLIHLKNINFPNINSVYCEKDSIYILENCKFEDIKFSRTIELFNGNFHLINLETSRQNITLDLIGTKDVILDFEKENNYKIITGLVFEYCEKIEINSNNSIEDLNLKSKKIKLNGLYNLKGFNLECLKKLQIGEKNKDTTKINLINWGGKIETKKLNLTNCIITNDSNLLPLNITYKELSGENFIIKSKTDIIINNETFSKPKDKDGYITITIKDIIENNLKNTLTQIKEKIESDFNHIPDESEQTLKKQIEDKKLEIKKLQEERKKIEEKYKVVQKKNFTKQLKRKKVNDFYK